MKARYVVDTNVLIAASAADPAHPKDIDATPADPELRKVIWKWLYAFEQSDSRMVLDWAGHIQGEYGKNWASTTMVFKSSCTNGARRRWIG